MSDGPGRSSIVPTTLITTKHLSIVRAGPSQESSRMITPDAKEWEHKSTKVLSVIRCFLDALRSAPNLKLLQLQSVSADDNDNQLVTHDIWTLIQHLHSNGIILQVQELQQLLGKSHPFEPPVLSRSDNNDDDDVASLGSFFVRQQNDKDERKQILHLVIFPLLIYLEQCYSILDNFDVTRPQSEPEDENSSLKKGKRKSGVAPPPIGMLSLNDYTNVACLLEFALSITLIPVLEYPNLYLPSLPKSLSNETNPHDLNDNIYMHLINKHTTYIIQKRIQALPKSLAGRVSKMALTWGTYDSLFKKLDVWRQTNSVKDNSNHGLHQLHHIYKILHTYNEMTILATTIGKLLLLDRFRPMLLPRHLSDVYLSLLIAERLRWYLSKIPVSYATTCIENTGVVTLVAELIDAEKILEQWNCERLLSLHTILLFCPMTFPSSFISTPSSLSSPSKIIDCREAVLAYRNLLVDGASMVITTSNETTSLSIPVWLRLRLGQCLSKLAQDDLQSVVEVFVTYAHGPGGERDENANASMNDDVMTGAAARLACALCAKPTSMHNSSSSNRLHLAFIKQLCTQFINFLVIQGKVYMQNQDQTQSRLTVAMNLTLWATLVQLPIESLHSFFVARLMSGLNRSEQVNAQEPNSYQLTAKQSMAAIVAWLSYVPSSLSLPSKEKIHSLLYKSYTIDNDLTLLDQILRLAASVSRMNLIVEVGDDTDLAMLAQKALTKMVGLISNISSSSDKMSHFALDLLKSVTANEANATASDMSTLIEGIECRVKCLLGALVSLSESDDSCSMNESSSTLFGQALLLHYSNTSEVDCGDHSIIRLSGAHDLLESGGLELKLTGSIVLGMMTDLLPPSLLLGVGIDDSKSDTNILTILGLIMNSAAYRMEEAQKLSNENDESDLLSTVSIVLNLLIALLELGADKRSLSDETSFQSMLLPLKVFATGKVLVGERLKLMPDLAEMASHAMALIVARGDIASLDGDDIQKQIVINSTTTILDATLLKLSEAECDLQSSQPPLRARGVVTLRHLAHSLINSNAVTQKALITEVEPKSLSSSNTVPSNEERALITRTLAKICLNALADPESYVYLASIQTIVTISDVCPSEILPLIGTVIAQGQMNISVACVDGNATFAELSLSPEQRIKAIESLIFMIGRRGDGIFLYGKALLDTMIFGAKKDDQDMKEKIGDAQLIQKQTHLYFMGAENKAIDNEMIDKKKICLNTGGPIFSMEETDLLRAGAILVVCELVSVLNTATVANYCHILVRLVTDALQLNKSRPVRRAAACLARDLYSCVMREVTESNDEGNTVLVVTIVDADEDILYNLLIHCVAANDLAISTGSALVDPATQCRCQEAVAIRQDLYGMGVLQAAALISNSLQDEMNDPVVQGVRRALSN